MQKARISEIFTMPLDSMSVLPRYRGTVHDGSLLGMLIMNLSFGIWLPVGWCSAGVKGFEKSGSC